MNAPRFGSALRILTRALILVFFLFSSSVAQIYPFRHYSTVDGLVQSTINTIFQDSKGFIWFGTLGGVSRYDGYQFTTYLSEDKNRPVIKDFLEDSSGTIWVATEGKGIARIFPGDGRVEWVRAAHGLLASDSIYSFLKVGSSLWIGTRRGVVIVRHDNSHALLTVNSGLPSEWVLSMAADPQGTVWVATTGGLVSFRRGPGEKLVPRQILQGAVPRAALLRDGSIVAGTNSGKDEWNKGVFRAVGGKIERILSFGQFGEAIKTQALLEDSRGVFWLGTTRGCILLEGKKILRLRLAQGLSHEGVSAILEDREGSIWIGTANGVDKLPRRFMVRYTEEQGLSGPGANAMIVDSQDRIWAGGFSGLARLEKGRAVQGFSLPSPGGHQVISMAEDLAGRAWIGTNAGLVLYDGRKLSAWTLGNPKLAGYISSLAPDGQGGLWVGAHGAIINIRGLTVNKWYGPPDGLPDVGIYALCIDKAGRIWFGTDGHGAGFIEHGSVTRFKSSDGLPHPVVHSISEDSTGRIWIGTRGGVACWQAGSFRSLHELEFPLGNTVINDILVDRRGHVWFASWRGVLEWADTVLAEYDVRDGVAADVVQAIAEDREGNLWFGTWGGISKFTWAERSFPIPTAIFTIERVSNDDEKIILPAPSSFSFDERTVTFMLRSMSFFDERNMEFQYMLEGLDKEWRKPGPQRVVRYTTLPAGSYAFHARVRNRNGIWSGQQSHSFEILPPFWATWWFRSGVFIALAGLLTILYRYRVARLLELERLRLRIATDLHDEIGSYLGSIALESEMIQRKSPVSEDVKQKLTKIGRQALRTAEAMRDIVWVINPQNDSLGVLVARMKEVAADLMAGTGYTMSVPAADTFHDTLDLEFKRNLYLIFKEALHNIAKHAKATSVEIALERKNEHLVLQIKDNGLGFDEQQVTMGNGLKNMRSRAAQMGGKLVVYSIPEKGTTIELRARI